MLIALMLALATSAFSDASLDSVRDYRKSHEHEILGEYVEFLSIPNVQADQAALRRNAEFLKKKLAELGLEPRFLEAPGSPAAVVAEWKVPGATRTLTFYAHYDGVAVNPEKWTGHGPFEPVLRDGKLENGAKVVPFPKSGEPIPGDWRIYARSATDDKAGTMGIVNAIAALKAKGLAPRSNLKFFFDGEEEIGSPHLADIFKANRELLKSDAWIIIDGSNDRSGRQNIFYGVRGSIGVELTVYGVKSPVHSGIYGNWAPSAATQLAKVLASLRDDDGRILVEDFYKGMAPLGVRERKALKEAPRYDAEIQRELGFARAQGGGKSIAELIQLPSLNVRSLLAGEPLIGTNIKGTNIIPATAVASIDIRPVKGLPKDVLVERLKRHLERKLGYLVLDRDPTDEERAKHAKIARLLHTKGVEAYRADMSTPVLREIAKGIASVTGQPCIEIPSLGGTLSMKLIEDELGAPSVGVPITNDDNNQHTDNENLTLRRFWDGIDLIAGLALMK